MTISDVLHEQEQAKQIRRLKKELKRETQHKNILATSNSALRAERAALAQTHATQLKDLSEKLGKERMDAAIRLASALGQSLSEVAGAQRTTAMAIASLLDRGGVF